MLSKKFSGSMRIVHGMKATRKRDPLESIAREWASGVEIRVVDRDARCDGCRVQLVIGRHKRYIAQAQSKPA
jgi:hypothetical protein